MKTQQETARNSPLIIILIGTSLLAIPAALGTFALFDTSSPASINVENFLGTALFTISICGFFLFAGYIFTAIFRQHNRIFWLCSAIYNFCISAFYVVAFIYGLSLYDNFSPGDILVFISNPIVLLPFWTIFVTISSFYYFKFARSSVKSDLP